MSQFVPASTSIKRRRVRNVDTDRLVRRRDFMLAMDFHLFDRRIDFVMRAAELACIENELCDRGVLSVSDRKSIDIR